MNRYGQIRDLLLGDLTTSIFVFGTIMFWILKSLKCLSHIFRNNIRKLFNMCLKTCFENSFCKPIEMSAKQLFQDMF